MILTWFNCIYSSSSARNQKGDPFRNSSISCEIRRGAPYSFNGFRIDFGDLHMVQLQTFIECFEKPEGYPLGFPQFHLKFKNGTP